MDGARYYKQRVEEVSSSASKKSQILDWLISKDIVASSDMYKAELLELVKQNKKYVPFVCVEIAKQYGYGIFFTPQYYYEFQLIEGVWAVVKDEVARTGPYTNLLEIRNKLLWAFKKKVNSNIIISLWRTALNFAKDYKKKDYDILLINDETDDESLLEDCIELNE